MTTNQTQAVDERAPGGGGEGRARSRLRSLRNDSRFIETARSYSLVVTLVALWIVFNMETGGVFLSQRNLTALAVQTAVTGLATVGAVMLIVTRNFDLSVGSAVALVGVIIAVLTVNHGWGPAPAIAVAMVVGVVVGAWQGWWTAYFGVPSFIVTLAGLLYLRGISQVITDGATVGPVPEGVTNIARGSLDPTVSVLLIAALVGAYVLFASLGYRRAGRLGLSTSVFSLIVPVATACALGLVGVYAVAQSGMPYLIVVLVATAIIAEVVMRKTVFGQSLYAIGSNEESARLAGIDIRRRVLQVFLISGLLYGIAGAALLARSGAAVAGSAGVGLELDAIAAAIIGGTSLSGGRGTIIGGLVGALLMASLDNGMSLMNVSSFYQQIVKGGILLLAVAVDVMLWRKRH